MAFVWAPIVEAFASDNEYFAKKFLGSGATANVYLATEDMSAFTCDS